MSVPVTTPPLDWPHYGIGFVPAVKRALKKYATFTGRASRGEFWWWVLGNAAIGTVLYLLMFVLGLATATKPGQVIGPAGWPFAILLLIWSLAVIIPSIAVTVRRLHDAGYSGWFYLFNLVGLGIITFVLCALETSPNAAKYGPPYPNLPPGSVPPGVQGQQYGQVPTSGQPGAEQDPGQPPPSGSSEGSSRG